MRKTTPSVWCVYEGADTRCVDTRDKERAADLHMLLLKHMERGHTLVTHTGSFRARRSPLPKSRCWGPPDSEMKMCTRVSGMAPTGTFPVDVDGKWHDLCVGNPALMDRSPFCSDAQRGQGGLASIQTKRAKQQPPAVRKSMKETPQQHWHRFRLSTEGTAANASPPNVLKDVAATLNVPEDSLRHVAGSMTVDAHGVKTGHNCIVGEKCEVNGSAAATIRRLSGPFCKRT